MSLYSSGKHVPRVASLVLPWRKNLFNLSNELVLAKCTVCHLKSRLTTVENVESNPDHQANVPP